MHFEARKFLEKVKLLFPHFFVGKRVVDIGSGDINGNNKYMFEDCEYVGVDVAPAPNVDVVSYAKDIPRSLGQFDVVVSSECFEHDMQIFESLYRILELLEERGLFFFTCASTGRGEHGTKRTSAHDSYSTNLEDTEWYPNYYQNLTMDDICKIIKLQDYFDIAHFEYGSDMHDLYFYGIRNGNKSYDNENYLEKKFSGFNSDKRANWHNYTRQYDALLSKFRYKNIKILEICGYDGSSLYAWRTAFPNATKILGIGGYENFKNYQSIDNAIYVEIGDQSNPDFLQNISKTYGPFDLIIDDGSHLNKDVIVSFETLFPLLNDRGLYIIEDTMCYNSFQHIDENYPSHLEYFSRLIPFLNQWDMKVADPFKLVKKSTSSLEIGIDKIEFGCSYIGIHKLVRAHWIK